MNELVSVIVPVFNTSQFLEKCIGSIVGQTYINLEVLLIDDGSTDESLQICNEWAKRDKRIKVYHQSNGGLSAARNKGLELHTGQYIYFVDSDDFIEKDAVEYLYNLLQQYNVDIAIGGYKSVDTNDNVIKRYETKEMPHEIILTEKELWERALTDIEATVVWSKLYKANLWKECRFGTYRIHEDNEVLSRILPQVKEVVLSGKQIYCYRLNPKSIMNASFSEKNMDKCYIFEKQCDYLHSMGWYDTEYKYWEEGSRILADGFSYLDSKNEIIQEKLNSLYCIYKNIILRMDKIGLSNKNRLKCFVFVHFRGLFLALHGLFSQRYNANK